MYLSLLNEAMDIKAPVEEEYSQTTVSSSHFTGWSSLHLSGSEWIDLGAMGAMHGDGGQAAAYIFSSSLLLLVRYSLAAPPCLVSSMFSRSLAQ